MRRYRRARPSALEVRAGESAVTGLRAAPGAGAPVSKGTEAQFTNITEVCDGQSQPEG
jgi:hypothetical protein